MSKCVECLREPAGLLIARWYDFSLNFYKHCPIHSNVNTCNNCPSTEIMIVIEVLYQNKEHEADSTPCLDLQQRFMLRIQMGKSESKEMIK